MLKTMFRAQQMFGYTAGKTKIEPTIDRDSSYNHTCYQAYHLIIQPTKYT